MTSTTDTQFSPFVETFGDTMTQLVEGAAEIVRESTKNYVTGLNAIVEQQRLAYEASQQWVSGVVSAQSNIRQQLVKSYDSAQAELGKTAEEAAKVAGEAGVEVADDSRNAEASANRRQQRGRQDLTPANPDETEVSADLALSSRDRRSGPAKPTRP